VGVNWPPEPRRSAAPVRRKAKFI